MKKLSIVSIALIAFLFCGCNTQKQVNYVTKYIANCDETQLRSQPSNDGSIIAIPKKGEAVSFECDSDNGYSKVVYNGTPGYILSVNLELVKPDNVSGDKKPVSQPTQQVQPSQTSQPETHNNSQYDKILSNATTSDIEKYITDYVRPYYYKVNNNIASYTEKTVGSKKIWYSGKEVVKIELNKGANGYNYSRQYYFDDTTGNLIFAFVFDGTTEYRLYFDVDRMVRFIDNKGTIYNNPTGSQALQMADFVLGEAYIR